MRGFLNKYFSLNRKDGKSPESLFALILGGLCILPPFAFFLSLPSVIYSGVLANNYKKTGDIPSYRASVVGLIMTLVGWVFILFLVKDGF